MALYAIGLVYSVAEVSAWITILVIAYERSGASAVGLAVVLQLVPAALLAPVVTAAGDRFPRHKVLAVGFVVLAAAAAGIATALVLDLTLVVVYGLAAVFTVALEAVPATIASLLVRHARTPAQLLRWNTVLTSARAGGCLIGPLATAAVLALADTAVVFGCLAVMCAATVLVITVRMAPDDRLRSDLRLASVVHDSIEGIRYVVRTGAVRRILVFVAATGVVVGTFDVVFVTVAFEQLGRGASATALVSAAFAAGALAVSALLGRMIDRRLTTLTAAGALALSLPLLGLGSITSLVGVLVLVGVLGSGNALVEISSQTLLQRTTAENMTSRTFGLLRSSMFIAISVGAAAMGIALKDHSLTQVLMVTGVIASIALVIGSFALHGIESESNAVDTEMIDALRTVTFLDALPLPTLERLAAGLDRRESTQGDRLIVQGDVGVEFFVLLDGAVDVIVDGERVRTLRAPASFGEVALLHGTARIATIVATEHCRLAVIEQQAFIDAVASTLTSHRSAITATAEYRRIAPDPNP